MAALTLAMSSSPDLELVPDHLPSHAQQLQSMVTPEQFEVIKQQFVEHVQREHLAQVAAAQAQVRLVLWLKALQVGSC
jgi:uncharacterized protein (DUF2249 family)